MSGADVDSPGTSQTRYQGQLSLQTSATCPVNIQLCHFTCSTHSTLHRRWTLVQARQVALLPKRSLREPYM